MIASDWFKSGWFAAMVDLREGECRELHTLRRDKAYRLGYRRGCEAYRLAVESFMAPEGE